MPSTSILTNGEDYIFLRYYQKPARVVKSKLMTVPLGCNIPLEVLRQQVEPIIMRIVGALELQKSSGDELYRKHPKIAS